MAFKIDDIIIDRIQMAIAEDFSGNLLYTLTQLSDATINITAESKDAKDNTGTLIKRFWQGKSGEFTATNAMLNLNVIGAASGEGKKNATSSAPIVMPKIITVPAGTTTVTLKDYVDGTVQVAELGTNGAMGTVYTKGTTPSATEYSCTSSGELKLPTVSDIQFIVKYDRNVTSGASIENKADKFPGTVKLTLKALAVDPCSADTLRGVYIVLPSFQVSPEVEINLTTEGNLNYKGDLQVDYCSADKSLYQIFFAEDDAEE